MQSCRRAVITFIAAAATLVATSSGPASAAETVEVPVEGMDPVVIVVDGDDIVVELPDPNGDTTLATQCAPVPGLGNLCVGTPTPPGAVPLSVGGLGDVYPLVKQGPRAEAALNPLVVEGIQATRAVYDVPNDGRILKHGRPELRAFLMERLLDIMDREAYGVPLTVEEQQALDYVEAAFAAEDRAIAEAAYDEFLAYQDQGCGYTPPPAPEGVTAPVPLPKKVRTWCQGSPSQLASAFVFAPPIPSVEEFSAWGAYRVASDPDMPLGRMGDLALRENLRDQIIVSATMGGMAAAGGLAGATAAVVGSVSSLSAAVVSAIGSHAAVATWTAGGIIPGATAGVGAAAAASVVAIVVVAIVVTAISIWMLVENESIGKDLKVMVDEARGNTDPLGLRALQADLGGKELRSEFDPADPPAYRSSTMLTKLATKVADWTTVDQLGISVPDPEALWPDNATDATDIRAQVRVGDGEWKTRDSFVVGNGTKDMTVRFDRGWMITERGGETARAALSFRFNTADGPRIATRAPSSLGGWYVTDPDAKGVTGEHVRALQFHDAEGRTVRVRLLPAALTNLAGPRPTLVGPLWNGRVHILRPNPVNADGTAVPLAEAESDYTYAWTLSRLDPVTAGWDEVETSSAFDPRFTPTALGDYQARVTMTSIAEPDVQRFGAVDFRIGPPPIATPVLDLVDDGTSQLEVDLQVQLPVPDDTVTAWVTWPPAIGAGQGQMQQAVLDCVQTGPLECTTVRTGLVDTFTRTLTTETDIRQPVLLQLTTASGGAQSYELYLDNPGRPRIAPPEAGANDGLPGSVTVTETATQVEMPIGAAYSDYVAATLVPGVGGGQGFGLVDPETGNTSANLQLVPGNPGVWASVRDRGDGTWELHVWGLPRITDVGSYEVPVVVQQTNTNRALTVVVVHVVPSAGDRFRAAIQSDVDPADFAVDQVPQIFPAVFGGRAEWPRYTGEMCVSMEYADFPSPVQTKCAPVADFVDDQGAVEPFPYDELYPTGLRSGTWRASAWLTGTGERVDNEPLGMSFLLTEDATYLPPRVDLEKPLLKGRPVVGRRLRTVVDVYPAEARLTYRWLRNGTVIRGAKARTYVLTPADRGKRIQVRVTAKLDEWRTAKATSAKTAKVRR